MRLFAVRLIKDKQAVGFFWAPDSVSLWWMIDSVCDPGECEYRRIKDRAAITWDGKVNAGLGTGTEIDDTTGECSALAELRRGLSFEYELEDYVFSRIEEGWTKVPYATEPGCGIYELFEDEERKKARKKGRKAVSRKKD
jgi:hypothetical protein